MSEIGSGAGSSYSTTLDTDSTLEINSPSASKTKARAEVINDLGACIVAIEGTLGTTPQGTKADVKTFLQTEHNANGTHGAITTSTISASGQITSTVSTGTAPLVIASTTEVANLKAATATLATTATTATTATNLAMTGEASAENAGVVTLTAGTPIDIVTLDLGSVTNGDRIFILSDTTVTKGATAGRTTIDLRQSSGTATIIVGHTQTILSQTTYQEASLGYTFAISGVFKVTGSGTLVMKSLGTSYISDGSISAGAGEIYAFFLKKQ